MNNFEIKNNDFSAPCGREIQSGRSMIEMLGVLAIIGVLSVGGIAGYSKAMQKYRVNKMVSEVSQIVANVRTFYSSQKNYEGLNISAGSNIIKKAKLIPEEMCDTVENECDNFVNPWGNAINIFGGHEYYGRFTEHDAKAFLLSTGYLPEEACIELATLDWGAATSSGLIFVAVTYAGGDDDILSGDVYQGCQGGKIGKTAIACPNGNNISVPMPIDVAAEYCSHSNSEIFMKFY